MYRELWNWLFALLIAIRYVRGHGRMEDPPARNAAWRYGFAVPANYDDVGLNCGGLGVQKSNGGKCGVCGDSYTGPRHHEIGGKYATNTIVRHFVSGALIDIKILLSANHNGFMEFRLCPATDSDVEVTQECLDQHLLKIEGFGTRYPIIQGTDIIYLRARLPRGLSCTRCVLQWRYHAGNNWGKDIQTGQMCLGCGPQEEFYNCADISITSKDTDYVRPRLTTTRPDHSLMHPVILPLVLAPSPIVIRPRTTTESIFPIYASEDSLNLFEKKKKSVHCYPTNEVLKPLLGIENWCLQLCVRDCPPNLCVCVEM